MAHARCGLNATGVTSPVRRSFTATLLRPAGRMVSVLDLRWELVHQLRPQVLDQLAHRLGDGFDVFEVENFLVDARSISAEWMIRPSKTRANS